MLEAEEVAYQYQSIAEAERSVFILRETGVAGKRKYRIVALQHAHYQY